MVSGGSIDHGNPHSLRYLDVCTKAVLSWILGNRKEKPEKTRVRFFSVSISLRDELDHEGRDNRWQCDFFKDHHPFGNAVSPSPNVTESLSVVGMRSNLWAPLHHDGNLPPTCHTELWGTTVHCSDRRNEQRLHRPSFSPDVESCCFFFL